MSVVVISVVKNECDIIELFIKHNLELVDKIHLLNHGSTDATKEIAFILQKRGYNVEIEDIEEVAFDQSKFITKAVRKVARSGDFDYIVPLDADEFLLPAPEGKLNEFFGETIGKEQWARMEWSTFCPVSDEYLNHKNPLAACFRGLSHELGNFRKIILGNEFAKNCMVRNGNHAVVNQRFPGAVVGLDYSFQHVPVRSSDQIVRKLLISTYAFALNAARQPGENFHWENMISAIRENDYRLPLEKLTEIALFYGNDISSDGRPSIDPSRRMWVAESATIEMPELARVDLLKSIDEFIVSLLHDLARNRQISARPGSLRRLLRPARRFLTGC